MVERNCGWCADHPPAAATLDRPAQISAPTLLPRSFPWTLTLPLLLLASSLGLVLASADGTASWHARLSSDARGEDSPPLIFTVPRMTSHLRLHQVLTRWRRGQDEGVLTNGGLARGGSYRRVLATRRRRRKKKSPPPRRKPPPSPPPLSPPPSPPPPSNDSSLSPPTEAFPMCKNLGMGPAHVTLNSSRISSRRWRGWGTSLSWFANFIGGLPKDQLDRLLDLLFDPVKGLGLNIARYNIAGGRNMTLSPQFPWPHGASWNFLPGFRPSATSAYDWTADEAQRRCLLGAKSRGANVFTAVSYSPPWWATVSGDVAGSEDGKSTNLRPDMLSKFADYLTEVIRLYAANPNWNITFEAVNPANEPSVAWKQRGRQEGCKYSVPDLAKLFSAVDSSLKAKKLKTKLVGFDEWALTEHRHLSKTMNPKTLSQIKEVHTHGYVMTNDTAPYDAFEIPYRGVREGARKLGSKPVWQVEWTFLRHNGSDLDLGLVLARNIVQCVNYMGVSAYVFWQALDKTPRFSLVWINWDSFQKTSYPHVITKKFWVMKHFAEYAPQGAYPLLPSSRESCEHCVTAFFNPGNSSLALFVVNQRGDATGVSLSFVGFQPSTAGSEQRVYVFRTSLTENFVGVRESNWTPSIPMMLDVPGRSLTTVLLTGISRNMAASK